MNPIINKKMVVSLLSLSC